MRYKTDRVTRLQLLNNNIEDYFEIEKFFEKIQKCDTFLSHYTGYDGIQHIGYRTEQDLRKINKETLEICEHCLFGIDWTKNK